MRENGNRVQMSGMFLFGVIKCSGIMVEVVVQYPKTHQIVHFKMSVLRYVILHLASCYLKKKSQ